MAGNPVLSTPDGARLDEAIAGLEFRVAVDIYLNETTRHADVVLPPTTTLERDHYDLAFHALAVRNTARFSRAVFAKPDDARHDWEIFRDLALGLMRRSGRSQPWKRWAVTQARMRLSPTRIIDGLLRTGGRRLSVRALTKRPEGVDLGAARATAPGAAHDARASGSTWPRSCRWASCRGCWRWPTPPRTDATSCCSSGGATSVTTTPGCTTPSG